MSSPATAVVAEHAHPLGTRVALEALGSFFIVFAGLATALFSSTGSASTVGFAYGLALLVCVIAFGHISQGYFNPAFSLALAIAGRLKWLPLVLFIVAQTVGALLASVVLAAIMKVMPAGSTPAIPELFAALATGFDAHSPSQVPLLGVLIVEVVLTMVLVAVILAATSTRNASPLAPVAIGLAVAVAVTITMPLDNGGLNPARAASVVFLADSWAAGQLWLFWLAPLFGAALAAAVYRSFAPAAVVAPEPAPLPDDEQEPDAVVPEPEHLPAPVSAMDQGSDAQNFFDGKSR